MMREREKKSFEGNEQEHCFNCHLMSKASPRTEAFDITSKTKRGSVCVIHVFFITSGGSGTI